MIYCAHCGLQYDERQGACPRCGTPIGGMAPPPPPLRLMTTDAPSGAEVETLGIVSGSTVQSVHLGKDIAASFKTLVGGELSSYTDMLREARAIATDRMMAEARQMGADAVVGIRYASASVTQGAAEIMAYGTAVRLKA